MDMTQFLRLIWPQSTNYFLFSIRGGKPTNTHVASVEQAVKYLTKYDTDPTANVYYSMASYTQAKYKNSKDKWRQRTQENVAQLKCFWIDLDCKGKNDGSDYASQKDALQDIRRLCAETELPLPTLVVGSGYGAHAYWVLEEAVDEVVWQEVSARWRTTLDAYSIRHDTSCTTDSARVLRVPGTHNRKAGAEDALVRIIGSVREPLSLEAFSSKLKGVPSAPAPKGFLTTQNADLSLNDMAEAGVEYRLSSVKEIIQSCDLLKGVAKVNGNVAEPLWHKVLGLLHYTTEAGQVIHFFSKGHPQYTHAETETKYASWNATGPPSCETLRRDASGDILDACKACKHFGSITGPIQLGYPKILMSEKAVTQTLGGGFIEGTVEVSALPASMQHKFQWVDGVLQRSVADKEATKQDGKPAFEWVTFCEFHFAPTAYYRDLVDKQQTVWALREREGSFKEFEITGGAIGAGGQALFKELGERGVTASTSGGRVHMEAYITHWGNELKRSQVGIETYMHYGWHGDSLLQGDTMYYPNGESKTVRVGGDASTMLQHMTPTGDVAEWTRLINEAYNHEGMEQYQFIMGAGFGSPLMSFMNVGGGTVLSAISHATGKGKTTAIRNAFGIYGCPDENTPVTLSRSSVTHKAVFTIAGLLHNYPVILDETTNIDGKELSDIVYTYSQGQPRIGLLNTGALRPVGFGWCGFMLSSSNKPMTGIIAGAKPGADAELARIIEFDCSSAHKLPKEAADKIFKALRTHYGVAGQVYLRWLAENTEEVKQMLITTQAMLDKKLGLTGENRFWSAGYAAIVVGSVIARRLGLISFDIKGLVAYIVRQVSEMRGGIADNVSTPSELFGRMLTEVSQGFIVTDIEGGRGSGGREPWIVKEPRGQYTGRVVLSTGIAYLAQPAVNKWCIDNQVDMGSLIRSGVAEGWVMSEVSEKKYPGRGTNYAMGQCRCFLLDWGRLENSTNVAPALAAVVQLVSKGGKK